ncbi:hypothetical protein [Synechococcus sp. MIT S9508]|uniref:hypothetical protein n=1 Tax=Synechococcus sp. MIT S9508 TaxID=1801629 RepID=UPI0007BB0C33|nr:hypothetical protein [Synechococcus sp. MIT S9508]KZR87120.1 hypothetical protein MITS9508_02587 [Synechococcus sp. MIT S9508]
MVARFLNNVRVRCKEGCEDNFIAVTKQWVNPEGMLDAYWAKTGERSYCFVGLWESEEKLVDARPQMIEHLNAVRDFFLKLSPELGVTDPVSGPVITHKP